MKSALFFSFLTVIQLTLPYSDIAQATQQDESYSNIPVFIGANNSRYFVDPFVIDVCIKELADSGELESSRINFFSYKRIFGNSDSIFESENQAITFNEWCKNTLEFIDSEARNVQTSHPDINKAIELCQGSFAAVCYAAKEKELRRLRNHGVKLIGKRGSFILSPENIYFSRYGYGSANIVDIEEIYNMSKYRQNNISGQGIKIALLESGANFDHPDISKHDTIPNYSLCYSEFEQHGTMVASIISAIAPKARISLITKSKSIFNTTELFESFPIINLSFAIGSESLSQRDNEFESLEFQDKISSILDQGSIIVKSAGNGGEKINSSLLDFAKNKARGRLLIVGNLNSSGTDEETLFDESNFVEDESAPFLCAPGTRLLAAFKDTEHTIVVGTSFATPIVSGCLALLMQLYPEWQNTPEKYVELLLQTARKPKSLGDKCGHGILDIDAACEEIKKLK